MMNMNHLSLSLIILVVLISCQPKKSTPYQDLAHSSKVFGKEKFYRLYLPEGYTESVKPYPVIYFFHGWGGRHFKDDNAKLEYALIKDLVDKYQVILIMWDGNYTEDLPRPYNMGYHGNIDSDIQMKDYFPELVAHVDSTYRTETDRNHRGLIGFSMGGLMSYFLAGKYPDMISAAVSMTGSPEFFIGYPDNHTLYPVRYAFKNLEGVKLRFHNSTHDELVFLNDEVDKGARWHGGLSYEFFRFKGGHVVDDPGKTEIFEKAMIFVANAFKNPLPPPTRWWHYDLYPEFSVWDYQVSTNKKQPGFIYLSHVSQAGFGFHSTRWLPDGPPLDAIHGMIATAPIYEPNSSYEIIQYDVTKRQMETSHTMSDETGKINLDIIGEKEIGIFQKGDQPDLVVTDYYMLKDQLFLRPFRENKLALRILNRGGELEKDAEIKVELTPLDSNTSISLLKIPVTIINRLITAPQFQIITSKTAPSHAEPAWIKFLVTMKVNDLEFKDDLVVPVFFDAPAFDSLTIDDGIIINDTIYGKGNGDGIVQAGESILIYQGAHKTRLYSDDPFVLFREERLIDEVLPSKWPDGFTLSSVVTISKNCPPGHVIEFLASYDSKTHMPIERKVTWGKIKVTVKR